MDLHIHILLGKRREGKDRIGRGREGREGRGREEKGREGNPRDLVVDVFTQILLRHL